ncbi:hypothetical protein BRC77_07025 [Halobacteriales archaeon QH_8_64_26]|nr:MAG: hypothetical protein BRC77_07025 [Halobacteriales archaeon QH_8_64_26]
MTRPSDERRYDRRDVLRAALAGATLSLAGCSESTPEGGSATSTGTPTATATSPSTTTRTTEEPTEEPTEQAEELPPVGELRYASPRDLGAYGDLVENRKLVALKRILSVPEAARTVRGAVSSSAYHRIFEERDFVEILAPHEMTVENGGSLEERYTITYDDIRRVRGVIDRESDRLLKLDFGRWRDGESHTIEEEHDTTNLKAAKVSLEHPRVKEVLADKEWYLDYSARDLVAAYSEEYPLYSLSSAGFNWNDREGKIVSLVTIVDTDAGEVMEVFTPTRNSPDPLTEVLDSVEGQAPDYEVPRGSIPVPGSFDPPETVSGHDWEVRWEDTLHDGYRIDASYKGKPVFGRATKIPWMLSDYEPFGMQAPGVPASEVLNFHFWDPLGVTGPGVLETHDLGNGFRIRGTFHTGSEDRWEWRFGQNYGPYRYIVDWSFFADGTCVLTSRHPTTGYRVTNGYPRYTFHVGIEPGFDRAGISAYRDGSWENVPEEAGFERTATPKLRIENSDGPERIVFEYPGERTYALEYDEEFIEYEQSAAGLENEMINGQQYLDPENHLQGASIEDEKLYLRTLSSKDTGEGLHATTEPFVFGFELRAENY